MIDQSLYRHRIGLFASVAAKKLSCKHQRRKGTKPRSKMKKKPRKHSKVIDKTVRRVTYNTKNKDNRLGLMTVIIMACVHCCGEREHGVWRPHFTTANLAVLYTGFCDLIDALANTYENFNSIIPVKVVNQSDSVYEECYIKDSTSVDILCLTILCCLGTCCYLLGNKGAHRYNGNPIENHEEELSRAQKEKLVEREMDSFIQDALGRKVTLVRGNIQLEEVDVIACAVDNSLNLAASGAVARALLTSGGKSLQEECMRRFPSGIKYGEVISINGGTLKCKDIYMSSIPDDEIEEVKNHKDKKKHPDSNTKEVEVGIPKDTNKHPSSNSEKVEDNIHKNANSVSYPDSNTGIETKEDNINVAALQSIVCEMLNKAIKEHVKSIALPAIGTSKMRLAPTKMANIMYDCVKNLPEGSLSEVKFVLNDKATYKAFEKEHYMVKDKHNGTILYEMTGRGATIMCKYTADLHPYLINVRRTNGWHILHGAVCSGSLECLRTITDIVIESKDQKYREQCMLKCLGNLGETILHLSCEHGDTELSEYIADMYPGLMNIRRSNGWHILHEVAYSGSIECLKSITDRVIENKDREYREQYMLKCLGNDGDTILHMSCECGYTELSEYIGDMYPGLINIRRNNGWHILHAVACSGSIECLKTITDRVIENKDRKYREQFMLQCLGNNGETILHLSCAEGDIELSEYIADIYPCLINIRRNNGWHILHEAACSGSIECLKRITDIVIENKDREYREQFMLKCLGNLGETILHISCEQGHIDLSKYIADMYPRLTYIRRNNGWHILHEAAYSGSIECLKTITNIVIENKDREYREQFMLKCLGNTGDTVLHLSCGQGHTELSEYIADMYPGLINIRQNNGWHILHKATCSGSIECLKTITDRVIENKVREYREQFMLQCLGNAGETILHLSCERGHIDLSKYIAELYPNLINIRRNDEWHIIHSATWSGSIECLRTITDVVIENKDWEYREQFMLKCLGNLGETILHLSCERGHIDLSAYIADMYPGLINIRRLNGWHILHEVANSGSIECLKTITDRVIDSKDREYREQFMLKCLGNAGETILHLSCDRGHINLSDYIAGMYPRLLNIRENNGLHILHEAAYSGSIECLRTITDRVIENRDREFREQFMLKCLGNAGETILHVSIEHGHIELSEYIADMYPSLINIRNNVGWHILHEATNSGSMECLTTITDRVIENKDQEYREQFMLKCLGNAGETILHLSCERGHIDLSKYIADMYPDLINIRRINGWHILHEAACSGSIKCLKTITDRVIGSKDRDYREQFMLKCLGNAGETILHLSCERGHIDLSKYIADMYLRLINIRRINGWHILHEAACSGSIKCLKTITDRVIGSKDRDYREQFMLKCLGNAGETILHLSCERGHIDLSKYIADMYPRLINIRRINGWHILHEAACSGSIKCLKTITDRVIGSKDRDYREQFMLKCLSNAGETILHLSYERGHTELSEYIADMYPRLRQH